MDSCGKKYQEMFHIIYEFLPCCRAVFNQIKESVVVQ